MSTFQPLVTDAGRAADAASKLPGGTPVLFANILFGDGNGSPVAPAASWTALVNQVCSVPVDNVYRDTTDPTIVWIEGGWGPATPRGFVIRELALQLGTGALYAVMAVPETEMPLATQGISRTPRFRIAIVEANDGGVVQIIDNPGQWATQLWVQQQITINQGTTEQWVLEQIAIGQGVTEQWVIDNTSGPLAQLLRAAAMARQDIQAMNRRLDEHGRRLGRLERAMGWARAMLDQAGQNVFRLNTNPTPDP